MDMIFDGWQAFRQSGFGSLVTSVEAQRLYAWLGLVAVLAVTLFLARRELKFLDDFKEADVLLRKPGRQPERPDSIAERIVELDQTRDSASRSVLRRAARLVAIGIGGPTMILFLVIIWHAWLMPGWAPPLQGDGAQSATPLAIGVFLLDQVFRGALGDIPEVFGLGIAMLENDPDNLVVSGLIVIYRAVAGFVSLGVFYLFIRVWRGSRVVNRVIGQLKAKRAAAIAAEAAE